jgi:hypothetical protein
MPLEERFILLVPGDTDSQAQADKIRDRRHSPRAARCGQDIPSDPNDSTELPYGVTDDGRLAHISEVAPGLSCRCRCPGCGTPLVARKGKVIAHHFAHHVNRACAGAWETTLHLLAKQVVAEAQEIRLPAAVAQVGEVRRDVADAKLFRYETVEVEVDMDGVRPDAIIWRGGRDLLLEFRVAHACETEKLAKLRERDLAAVEIDLSRVPRHASRAEHADHILRTAPRHWLHNAKIAAEEARLREHLYSGIANEVAVAWVSDQLHSMPDWRTRARDAGFGNFTGLSLPGDRCCSVDPQTWQSAFLDFAVVRIAGQIFSAEAALHCLQQLNMLKEPFRIRRDWDPELVAYLREREPGFRSPIQLMADYADLLTARGLLERTGNGWRGDAQRGREASMRSGSAHAARQRIGELHFRVGTISVASLGFNNELIDEWAERPLPKTTASPNELARAGGAPFADLMRRLDAIADMLRPGGRPLPSRANLLGLPLERDLRAKERDDRIRRVRERRGEPEWRRP